MHLVDVWMLRRWDDVEHPMHAALYFHGNTSISLLQSMRLKGVIQLR